MRSDPTRAELRLWRLLRKRQLGGFKFRRQHIIQTFIVDFYCPPARLVVELDGEIHANQTEYDSERDQILNALGYKVLRFKNEQIEKNIEVVLKTILAYLGNDPAHPPSP